MKTSLVFISAAIVVLLLSCYSVAAAQPVTVATNSQNYSPGEQVLVTVRVLQPGGVNADAIWVFVTQPNGVNNYFEMLPPIGGQLNFTLAMNAPFGNYTLVVEWNYPTGDYVTTWFAVTNLPMAEFPSGPFVMLLAFAFIYGSLDGRKAQACSSNLSTASPPSHIC